MEHYRNMYCTLQKFQILAAVSIVILPRCQTMPDRTETKEETAN